MSLLQRDERSRPQKRGDIRHEAEKEAMQGIMEATMRYSGYLELRGVKCEFHEGIVTLRGRVPTYYLKQLAQSLVWCLEGVQEISNRLEVIAPPQVRT